MSKILLVDDDKITLAISSRILMEAGYSIEHASSLNEVKKQVTQNEYSLVITDMNMPEAEGSRIIELLKKIRPSLEVIVMTAYGTLDSAVACMRAGAIDFLLKPCKRQQLLETVEKAVKKKELSQENVMLRGLNEMKDKFLTLVSHELRTPLTLIYGYLTILHRQSASFTEEQASLLGIVLKASKQLIDIVKNVQTITQAENGEIILHLQPVLVMKLLTDIVAEVKVNLNDRQLVIRLADGEELEPIIGDSIRLHQAVVELVQNSIRNTKDGGEIVLGVCRQPDRVLISVRDNGIGIPEGEQGKIFERFYEVADVKQHSSGSSKFGSGGIGLGLVLVKRIVEAHRGTIHLESEPGKGTHVEIMLPILPATSTAAWGQEFNNKLG